MFLGIYPLFLDYPVFSHIILHNHPLWSFFIYEPSILIFPLSFLIFLFYFFFYLIYLKIHWFYFLFVCFSFSKNQWVRVSHLVSRLLSEGINPYITVYLVCSWEEEKSGTFYSAILCRTLRLFILNTWCKLHLYPKDITCIIRSFKIKRKKTLF